MRLIVILTNFIEFFNNIIWISKCYLMRSGALLLPLWSRWPLTLNRRPDGSSGCEISALICSACLCVQRWQIYCKVVFVTVQSPRLYSIDNIGQLVFSFAPSCSVQWRNAFKQDPVCHFKCVLANNWLKTVTDWLSVMSSEVRMWEIDQW